MAPIPPQSEEQLLTAANRIAGRPLKAIAADLGWSVPEHLQRHKGWTGQLLEAALGATAGSLAEPDFQAIGVELKSLPVVQQGQTKESTYVCTVPLDHVGERWEQSWVRHKLQRVLWIPIEADDPLPIAERRVGMPLLWSPSAEEEQQLRDDWEELMELISLGRFDQLSAHHGEVLQIRPKAANSRVLTEATGDEGEAIQTLPRGFYLRRHFTQQILERYYANLASTKPVQRV